LGHSSLETGFLRAPALWHNSGTILLVTALEITRRFQWSLFRVEKAYLQITRLP
jgi:hypothetical protein